MNKKFHAALRLRRAVYCALLGAGAALSWCDAAEGTKAKPETLLSVAISQIALMTLSAHVAAYGVVEPAGANADLPPAGVHLSAPFAGLVTAIPVVEGQHVEKGDILVRLESRTASGTADASTFVLTAPVSGVVARLNVGLGELADPTKPLLELVDPARLVVSGMVPSDDASSLKLGRPVEITTNLANSKVLGSLLSVSPIVDEKTGGVAVRASLPANAGLRPGQFVKLKIATEEHANILAVPVESLVNDPDVGYVIALIEGDRATQKHVRVGIRDGDFVEVEGEGVKVGQTVAAEGAYALPKESKVHVITPVD